MWTFNLRILKTQLMTWSLIERTSNNLGGTINCPHLDLGLTSTALTHAECRASHFYAHSPSSSEYSTGSTLLTHLTVDEPDCIAADASDTYHNTEAHPQPNQLGQSIVEKHTVSCTTTNQSDEILACKKKTALLPHTLNCWDIYYYAVFHLVEEIYFLNSASVMPPCDHLNDDDGIVYGFSSHELNSPPQVTPVFRSLSSGIPSPQFTESVS